MQTNIKVKEPKMTELIDEDEELMDEEQINEIKTFLILHRGPPSPTGIFRYFLCVNISNSLKYKIE